MSGRTNWAGNYSYRAGQVHYPGSVAEIQELVVRNDRVKALGTRHSFNDIADSPGCQVSTQHLTRIDEPNTLNRTVTLEAGVTYGQLCPFLHSRGFALHNLASLPHIAVAGACATATHGSGDRNGNLATAVNAIEYVTANGDVEPFSREVDGERFAGTVVALGGLGVVVKLTLDIVPAFQIAQTVYENLPFRQFASEFESIAASAYSVSFFTDWRGERFNQVWMKRRIDDATRHELPTPANQNVHPISGLSPVNCTQQLGVPGPWHERLPHFRMDFTPSAGEELQSEYFVPREHAVAAIRAIDHIRDRVAPLVQISEIRTIAADRLWMSPCYQQPCIAIHFTWKKDWPAVKQLLPQIERQLSPFAPRPHRGKLFTMRPSELRARYPKLPDFRDLLRSFDPDGKFRNEFIDAQIFD